MADGKALPRAIGARSLYTATIFLSAGLLFAIQPMVAKLALPHLGGTPAVWAVSMCVFQGLLLGGYCYAHLVGTRLSLRSAAVAHVLVLCAAALTLPVTLRLASAEVPSGGYVGWLVATLALTIGLPFFALAANAPLLQKWYSHLGEHDSADPYRLYVASNAGSLLALVSYPVLVEPFFTVTQQRYAWTFGYVALVILVALAGLRAARSAIVAASSPASASTIASPATRIITARDRLGWLALAFVPSGLLVAVTTFLTTDLASAPLLWVIPLALYLVTYIMVFRDPSRISVVTALRLAVLSNASMLLALEWDGAWTWLLSAVTAIMAFFTAALACHRLLYERRPPAVRLTEFYFFTSLGGVLGGIGAALIAPLLVTEILELPLLLGAAFALGAVIGTRPGERIGAVRRIVTAIAAIGALIAVIVFVLRLVPATAAIDVRLLAAASAFAAVLATIGVPRMAAAAGIAMIAAVTMLPHKNPPFHTSRSFFGTHRVMSLDGGRIHTLLHGTTIHGIELRADTSGRPLERPPPLAYYHQSGPIAGAIMMARFLSGSPRNPLTGAVIGLGAGALACHAMTGDSWTFFELDPDVVRIASDPRYFRYLSACQPGARIVLGDARQTLARERSGRFDYILLDAFSSDAIPVHLLTREALVMNLDKLAQNGVLAMHVSNQNLDLIPSIEATLATIPEITAVYAEGTRGNGALASQVVLVSRDPRIAGSMTIWTNMRKLGTGSTARPWTDDYSDIVRPMILKMSRKIAGEN